MACVVVQVMVSEGVDRSKARAGPVDVVAVGGEQPTS